MKFSKAKRILSAVLSILMVVSLLPMQSLISVSAAESDACVSTDGCNGTYKNGFCSVCDGYQPAEDTDGDSYYEIGNAGQLYWWATNKLGNNAVLTADIVVNENVLKDDGTLNGDGSSFRSWIDNLEAGSITFNGNNHTISGLYISGYGVGFFREISRTTINNLGIIDSYFNNTGYATGALAGYVFGPGNKVNNCYSTATVTGHTHLLGGLLGACNHYPNIINCYYAGYRPAGGCFINYDGYADKPEYFTNCYYLAPSECDAMDVTKHLTAEQFASGEAAYILNGSVSGGTTYGQKIGVDKYPVLGGDKVYKVKDCQGNDAYSNTNESGRHKYNNGFCSVCDGYEPAVDSDGDSYYEISNAGQLYWFANYVNTENASANAILMKDIVVNENLLDKITIADDASATVNAGQNVRVWTPIGVDNKNTYNGKFDGNGHTVSGLYYNDITVLCVGLFGRLENGAVSNLGVLDSYLAGNEYVGSIAGALRSSSASNCHSSNCYFEADYGSVGGLFGSANGTTITDCYNENNIIKAGNYYIGGIVGYASSNNTIKNCYNTGAINGTDAGGIAGEVRNTLVENCYNTGTIDGGDAGGIVGKSEDSSIIKCKNSGTVVNCTEPRASIDSHTCDIGGICGYSDTSNILNCYNEGAITGWSHVGGIAGYILYGGKIENCYNAGAISNIKGSYRVGSICGIQGSSGSPAVANCYYLTGTHSLGIGYTNSSVTNVEEKTSEQFASGEVAYLLQGEQEDTIWGQNVDNGQTVQAYPVFSDAKVYHSYVDCDATELSYSNTDRNIQGHYGGTATCQTLAICDFCGNEHGEVDPENHVSDETYLKLIDETNHGKYHYCCDALIETEAHTVSEATCQGISYCSVCDTSFGSIDKNNHTGVLEAHYYDKHTHIYKYSCCGMREGDAETHKITYTVDEETDTITAHCEDCDAEGSVTMSIENDVYDGYSNTATYTSTGILNGWNSFATPTFTYSDENGCKKVGDYTATMTIGDVSVSKDFTISKRVLEITFARGSRKTYDTTNIIRLSSYDVANVVVYDKGYYEDMDFDDIRDDVAVDSSKLFATVSDSVPGSYDTCKIEGVELVGEDKDNYTIAESFENVPLKGDYGDFGISEIEVWIEPQDQFITDGDELDQTAYTVRGLDPMFTLEGVELYELDERTIAVNTENVKVTHNGVDITEYCNFDRCSDFTANLSKVCEGHTFDDNGFCATGNCETYQPAKLGTATDEYGSKIEVYKIYNAGQLYWYAEQVNVYGNTGTPAVLVNDIVVNEDMSAENLREWTPINSLYATFDGQGHTISGLYCDSEETYVGLFGYHGYYNTANLGITNSYFKGNNYVGAIAGYGQGAFTNCFVDDTVKVIGNNAGGLIGDMSTWEPINNCYSLATVEGETLTGGLVGYSDCNINNCYTTSSSLVGSQGGYYDGEISNCYYVADEETDEYDGTTAVTADKLASGEVAYLLQAGVKGEEIYDEETDEWVTGDPEEIWGQRIGTETYPVLYGRKVYEVSDCKGNTTYSNTDEDGQHNFKNGICTICGVVDGLAQVVGYSITLEDKIAVNYFMKLADEVINDTASKVVFNYIDSGETYTKEVLVSDATKSGDNYKFTCEVAAKEMTSNIAAQVVTSNDKSKVFNYSVKQYAEVILADAETYAKEQNIVKAMLNYGANAQVYFNNNTDNLANDTVYMTEDEKAVNVEDTVFDSFAHSASGKANGLTYYGSALSLESETAIKLYFTYDNEADIANVNVASNGKTVTHQKNGKYYEVKISGIRPDELNKMYETTVNGVTVNYGAFSYGKMAMGTSNENLKNVVKTLYAYSKAALEYKKA